jgi:hypothetical protein
MRSVRTRALRAVVIAAALTRGVVVGFLLLRPGGAEHQPQATIEQALADFMGDRFGVGYVGTCPVEFPADGDVPRGMCSARFAAPAARSCIAWAIRSVSGSGRRRSSAMHLGPGTW